MMMITITGICSSVSSSSSSRIFILSAQLYRWKHRPTTATECYRVWSVRLSIPPHLCTLLKPLD